MKCSSTDSNRADLLAWRFCSLAWTRLAHICTTWSRVAPTSSSKPRPSARVPKALNKTSRTFITKYVYPNLNKLFHSFFILKSIANNNNNNNKSMTLKEATKHALSILKQVMEEKLISTNIEVKTRGNFLLLFVLLFCASIVYPFV